MGYCDKFAEFLFEDSLEPSKRRLNTIKVGF